MEVAVSPEDDAEIRRMSVTNHSRGIREIELTSYAEVVLAPHAADLAHPAFSNLFIESSAVPEYDAIICARRPRAHEGRLFMGHVLAGRPRVSEAVEFETNREYFIGRGSTTRNPRALRDAAPLSGAPYGRPPQPPSPAPPRRPCPRFPCRQGARACLNYWSWQPWCC
jgi:cyclic beta-1,2-glucan synthetase